MTASCIYEGTLRHRRFAVHRREFSHRLALTYIDLDELPRLLSGRLIARRPGLLRFRRGDYHGDPMTPLDTSIRDAVQEQLGVRPTGPIRVLTQLRSFGHCFNPVSFYYCLDEAGNRVEAVLAEVTNTPWGERHSYVLAGDDREALSGEFEKRLHVSPFMGMDQRYLWRLGAPGRTLSVHIENFEDGALAFDATLALRRTELTPAGAASLSVRYPFATLRVLALIYAHAVGLRLSGIRTHSHAPARTA